MSREYPARPIVGVGAVVWRGDQVLLIRRAKPPRPGRWSLPGGAQKLGETLAEAAAREVREETGVAIAIGPLVDAVDAIERDDNGQVQHHYSLVDFAADWVTGEPEAGGDATEATWFTLVEIERLDLWSETLRIIRLAAARRKR